MTGDGALIRGVVENMGRVVLGKDQEIRSCVIALIAGGHVMVEDFPGVGKTLLARALARSVDCRFKRIQFTPDLLPSDVTGVNIYNQKSGEFEFRPGPIFANIVLADEINRASPRAQSSLLECMQEMQATIDGTTHAITAPFMVIATQNPIEYEGTYPLPEAQLDRFMLRVSLGYPTEEQEMDILDEQSSREPLEELTPVLDGSELLRLGRACLGVRAVRAVREYVVTIVDRTRSHPDLYLGASPRAGISLLKAAKARAMMEDRNYVVPHDIKSLAENVLTHRLILAPEAKMQGFTRQEIVEEILESVPVPG